MLEKPDFPDEKIIACLWDEYRLKVIQIAFLPLGADVNTAVYRATGDEGTPYFVKLRQGDFEEMSVVVPKLLHKQGVRQIIVPLETRSGGLWARLESFTLILYPFVEGQSGYGMSDRQWVEFGRALKGVHTVGVPPTLREHISRESFSPRWREIVKGFQAQVEETFFEEPVAAEVAALLKLKRQEISDLVGRADRLGTVLQRRPPEFVLCHSDIHGANILIGADEVLYLVDWDNPILAPKERDLMFAGGGQFGARRTPEEEERLFYEGYGQTQVNPIALAYYRYERIIQDIAAFCEQLLLSDEGGEDREQSLGYLKSNFLPNGILEIAYRSEKKLPQNSNPSSFEIKS